MAATLARKKTLAPTNQFCFTCPIFNVETKIASCFALRDEVWRGRKPEVRKGCQVALHDSKCPVYWILAQMDRDDEYDPHHAAERHVGHLDRKILERIAPIQVQERTIERVGVSDKERALLLASNSMKVSKPKGSVELEDVERSERKVSSRKASAPVEKKETVDATVEAAMSGDLSAAITRAAAKPVEPAPAPAAPATPPKSETPSKPAPAPGKPLSLLERARLAKGEAA